MRVSAPGYLSARQYLGETTAGYKPVPVPLPEAFCKARYGKPNCLVPSPPDGNFALQPTSIELKQMGSAAQAGFGLPKENPFQMPYFVAAAFSANGQYLALVGIISPPYPPQQSACVGWIYHVESDQLQRIEPELPSEFCQGLPPRIHWADHDVILKVTDPLPSDGKVETMRWRDGSAEITPVEKPNPVPNVPPNGFEALTDETEENVLNTTDDGEFLIVDILQDCRQCDQRIVTSRQQNWKIQIENPIGGYLLDHENDRLVSFPANKPNQDMQSIGVQITNLKSRQQQIVVVPALDRPQLMAAQLLNNGRTRLAYTIVGVCDPFNPTVPHDPPAGASSASFTKRSLCIVTTTVQQNAH